MAERREDVRPLGREERGALDRLLQQPDRLGVVVAPRRGEAQCDARAERSGPVARRGCFRKQPLERLLGRLAILVEPEPELGVCEP